MREAFSCKCKRSIHWLQALYSKNILTNTALLLLVCCVNKLSALCFLEQLRQTSAPRKVNAAFRIRHRYPKKTFIHKQTKYKRNSAPEQNMGRVQLGHHVRTLSSSNRLRQRCRGLGWQSVGQVCQGAQQLRDFSRLVLDHFFSVLDD